MQDVAEKLRTPFLIASIILLAVVVLIELGSPAVAVLGLDPPGHGIPYLALLDGLVLFTMGLIGAGLVVPESILGRFQGIATLIFALLVLLACIALIIAAVVLLIVMVTLLLSPIFGTAAYFVLFGSFPRPAASAVLSLIMTLKLAFGACLVLAHQRFLQNRGLVLIILTSLLATFIVSLLHGIVPRFLVSITDVLAAIVVGILALIWAVLLLIGSIPSILSALQFQKGLA